MLSYRWLLGLLPLVFVLASFAQYQQVYAGEGGVLLNAGANCSGSTATITFSWTADGDGAQWLDLSVTNNGFADGTYLSAGPLSANQSTLAWQGVLAGRTHYWRITSLGSNGWKTSVTGSFTPCPAALPPASPVTAAGLDLQLLQSQNADRSAAGLAPLTWDDRLAAVARGRANDMAANGYFAHTSPSGESAFTILQRMGISYRLAGENLARNNVPDSQSVQTAETGFMGSQTHRANILEPSFTRAGIAVSFAGDMKYFVVIYAAP